MGFCHQSHGTEGASTQPWGLTEPLRAPVLDTAQQGVPPSPPSQDPRDRKMWGAAASYRRAVGWRGRQLGPGRLRACMGLHGLGGLRDTEAHGGEQAGVGKQHARSDGAAGRGHAGGGGSNEHGWSGRRLITRLNPPPRARRSHYRRPLTARARSAGTGDPERRRAPDPSMQASTCCLHPSHCSPGSASPLLAPHPRLSKTPFSLRTPI